MTGAPLPLAGYAAVSLDELVSEASLMTRVDRKYLVPLAVADAALHLLDPRSRVLEINGLREFSYDSVYFDTPDRLSYRLTAQSRRRRFKLRTRTYLDTGGSFLELKTKSGRGATVKDRLPYDRRNRERITAEGRRYVRTRLAEQRLDDVTDQLRPALVSRYRRATILLPCGSRATIDTALHWSALDDRATGSGRAASAALPGFAIIESKSTDRANEIDRLLWRAGHRPSGISKFGTGTAALHPEVPANKWSRTLRGPFASAVRDGSAADGDETDAPTGCALRTAP